MAETVTKAALFVQGLASLSIASLTCLSAFTYAWPSYTMQLFKSNATVLSSSMSTTEIAFLGSSTNVGAMIATPLCGYAMDKLGRKYTAMMFGLPFVVTWGLISVSTSVYVIIFAIGFAGVGAAGLAASNVYISEISQDSIRGGLTSILTNGFIVGLLISYILGGQLTYHNVIYIHLAIAILYILMVASLKESPVYLIKINKEKEAKESLAFYRQVDKNSKDVEVAISKIRLQLDPQEVTIQQTDNEDNNTTNELLEKQTSDVSGKAKSPWQYFKKSESSKRAMGTVLIIMTLSNFMGPIVIQVYALVLFQKAIPTMDLNTCCILLCIVYLLASTTCSFIVDKLGRKFLYTTTAIGTGLLSIVLGTQLHLGWAPHWFTAVVIYTYCFTNNLGVAVIPGVLMAEVFLPEVRGFCTSCIMVSMWFSYFIILFIFTPLVEACGLGPTFYVFSLVCFTAASFTHMRLPETKGLSVDAIQLLFIKKK